MKTNYVHVVEMTDDEKFAMYMKLTKAEIVRMHIELEKCARITKPHIDVNAPLIPHHSTGWPAIDNRITIASITTTGDPTELKNHKNP